MKVAKALKYIHEIVNHPLNAHQKSVALQRWLRWHVGSRIIPGDVVVPFVQDARLVVRPHMRGATENIYLGLSEYQDMLFLMHLLREDDLFIDTGANVGAYTVLASKVCGARSIAFEPVPVTFGDLVQNIQINGIERLAQVHNLGMGSTEGTLKFTADCDCINHVIAHDETFTGETIEVSIKMLDQILQDESPTLIKIDVEGFELPVIRGASKVLNQPSLLGVIMELNGSGARYGYSDREIHQTMLDHCFQSFQYDPFERQLNLIEIEKIELRNVLYLKNLEEVRSRLERSHKLAIHDLYI
jgi:FkbM family methyltransferase